MERIEESRQVGYRRAGISYSLRRASEFLFMPSQIQGFEDLRGVLKVRNFVTTLQIPIVRRPERTEAFVPRPIRVLRTPVGPPDEALTFEPAALPNPME